MTDSDFLRAISKDVFTRADQKVIDSHVSADSKLCYSILLKQGRFKTDAWWYCMLAHFSDNVDCKELAKYIHTFTRSYTQVCTLRAYLMNKRKSRISLGNFVNINEVVKYIPKKRAAPYVSPAWDNITLDTWKTLIDMDARFLEHAPPHIKEHPEIVNIIPNYPYLLESDHGTSTRLWSRLTREQCQKIIYDFKNSDTATYAMYADELSNLVDSGYLPCDILLRTKITINYNEYDFAQVQCNNPLVQYMMHSSVQCVKLIATEYPLYLLILMNLGEFHFEKLLRKVPPSDRFRANFVFAYDRCDSRRCEYKNIFKQKFHANIDYEPRYKRVFDISDFATNTHSQLDPDMCIAAVCESADNIKHVRCYGCYVYDSILQMYPDNIGDAPYLPEQILKKIAEDMPALAIKLINKIPNIIKYRPRVVLEYDATDEHWIIAVNRYANLLTNLKQLNFAMYSRILPRVNCNLDVRIYTAFDLLRVNDMMRLPPNHENDDYHGIKNGVVCYNKFVMSWKAFADRMDPPKSMIKWAHHNTEYLFFDGEAKSLIEVYNFDELRNIVV